MTTPIIRGGMSMLHETIEVKLPYAELGIEKSGAPATITTYIKERYPNDQDAFLRPLIIICPGGGYHHHSPREGEAIAIKMLDMGYNALILRYSLMPNAYPCQAYELAYAVKYARDHADEWDVNPEKIIVAGFSAGAHVAATVGTMWNKPIFDKLLEKLEETHENIKPDGMLMGYPVITSDKFAHRASFERLLQDKYDELIEEVSLENQVDSDTPPVFMWHTFSDNSVPLENSLIFANALRKNNIKFEYHVFPNGEHGLGFGTKETSTKNGGHMDPQVGAWTNLFGEWMKYCI